MADNVRALAENVLKLGVCLSAEGEEKLARGYLRLLAEQRAAVELAEDLAVARVCSLWRSVLDGPAVAGDDDSAEMAELGRRTRNVIGALRTADIERGRAASVRAQLHATVARLLTERDDLAAKLIAATAQVAELARWKAAWLHVVKETGLSPGAHRALERAIEERLASTPPAG